MSLGKKIGFIGAGQMAEALARGFAARGIAAPGDMWATDPVAARRAVFADFGATAVESNVEVRVPPATSRLDRPMAPSVLLLALQVGRGRAASWAGGPGRFWVGKAAGANAHRFDQANPHSRHPSHPIPSPQVAQNVDILFIAVKPQYVETVLAEVQPYLSPSTVIVSIAAGVPLATLGRAAGRDARLVRVMPNTPCLVGETAAAMCLGGAADEGDAEAVRALFSAVGVVHRVEERLLSAVTGLSGSGPAYGFLAVEALADGGVRAGLPRDIATQLAAQTLLGAARMVLETGKHPGALKDMVTSPAGTTIAGVAALERAGLRSAFIEAVAAASARAEELAAAGS